MLENLNCAEKTKGRRWILSTNWPVALGLIIPRLRDRWFKSSPRNQFFFAGCRQLVAFTFSRIAKEDFTSACPTMSIEELISTIAAKPDGHAERDLGSWYGKAASYRFR